MELRLELLRHWYVDLLSAEQWRAVAKQVRSEVVEVAAELRAVPLDHHDEPLPLFTPYRSDG